MTDKIIDLHTTRKAGHGREVPSENPDAPHSLSNLRGVTTLSPVEIFEAARRSRGTLPIGPEARSWALEEIRRIEAALKALRMLLGDDDGDSNGAA